MTAKETADALVWLNAHWPNKICPFHGPTNWEIGDSMIMTLPYTGAGIMLGGGPTYPFVVVTCGQCGYTVLVNAIKMGILPIFQPPAVEPQQAT
jgi:hypothetical protein